MESLWRYLLEPSVGTMAPFPSPLPAECCVIVTYSLFCALAPAPSQPLLCKFADSQRKKHGHGGFVPNGQTSDLRLVCNCCDWCFRPLNSNVPLKTWLLVVGRNDSYLWPLLSSYAERVSESERRPWYCLYIKCDSWSQSIPDRCSLYFKVLSFSISDG